MPEASSLINSPLHVTITFVLVWTIENGQNEQSSVQISSISFHLGCMKHIDMVSSFPSDVRWTVKEISVHWKFAFNSGPSVTEKKNCV